MVFSAIAMVAFSVSGFASTDVVEKEEAVASKTPCADQWSTDMDVLQGKYKGSQMNLSYDKALEIADKLFNECLEKNYGTSQNIPRLTK